MNMANKDIDELLATSPHDKDPIWHVEAVVLLALILQITLPDEFVAGPRFILPILEVLLVISLYITSRKINLKNQLIRKFNSVTLIVLIALANVYALQRLAHLLLAGGRIANGEGLILTAINIFITNGSLMQVVLLSDPRLV
jgi:hypothetical protein